MAKRPRLLNITPDSRPPPSGRVRDFDTLTPAYKQRITSAGGRQLGLDPAGVRSYYESGGNLQALRRGLVGKRSEGPHRITRHGKTRGHRPSHSVGTGNITRPAGYPNKADMRALIRNFKPSDNVAVLFRGLFSYRGGSPKEDYATFIGNVGELRRSLNESEFLEDALEQWVPPTYLLKLDVVTYLSVADDAE